MTRDVSKFEQDALWAIAATAVGSATIYVLFYLQDLLHFVANLTIVGGLTAFVKSECILICCAVIYGIKRFKSDRRRLTLPEWLAITGGGVSCLLRFARKANIADFSLIVVQSAFFITFLIACGCGIAHLQNVSKKMTRPSLLFSIICLLAFSSLLTLQSFYNPKAEYILFGLICCVMPILLLAYRLIHYNNKSVELKRAHDATGSAEHKKNHLVNTLTIMLFFSIMISTLYYFNREATDLEGIDAYCATLMGEGKMVYKDFFFYVPPLYIFRQYLVWNVFDGAIFAVRLIGIAERALLFCLIFRLLSRWFKPAYAYMACLLGYAFYNTNVFNSYGDYTQTCQMLLIGTAYFAAYFVTDLKNGREKSAYWKLFTAGALATQSLMCKQSIGIVALAFLFLTLLVHALAAREGKRTWKWIGCVLFSFAASLLPYLVWLISNGALTDFIDQIFLASLNSKGIVVEDSPTETSTMMNIFRTLVNKKSLAQWIGCSAAIAFRVLSQRVGRSKKLFRTAFMASMAAVAVLIAVRLQVETSYFTNLVLLFMHIAAEGMPGKWILFAGITVLMTGVIAHLHNSSQKRESFITAAFSMCVFAAWFWTTILTEQEILSLLQVSSTSSAFSLFYEFAFHACVIFFAAEVIQHIACGKGSMDIESWYYLAVAAANAFVSLMGGGTATFACNGALYTVPFAVCLVLTLVERMFSRKRANVVEKKPGSWKRRCALAATSFAVLILTCNVILVSMAQHINCVYSFHGWTAMPISDVRAYEIELDRYDGMLVSKRTKLTLEQITKVVAENSNEDDFVWSFPATKIYNLLADRIDQPTFATTYFFDTCPDSLAISDLEVLKENPPVIIIWKELAESTWSIYETNYRNGMELGQREIQRWFNSVRDTEYTLIGNVYNEYVYLRNDREPVYTYFSDGSDLVGSSSQTADNVKRFQLCNAVYDCIASFARCDTDTVMTAFRIVLLAVSAAILLAGMPAWKAAALLLFLVPASYKISWVYAFIFVIPLISAMNEEKSYVEWLICILMAIVVITSCLQWYDAWGIAESWIVLPLLNAVSWILVIDGIVGTIRRIMKKRRLKRL